MSFSPKPSYHLCPSFTIAPPPKGHLDLGSILPSLDSDGVDFPINVYCREAVPAEQQFGPDEKQGFTRTLKELRAAEASIWAKIFSLCGARFNFLRERSDDETLTVDKLITRYFVPSEEYMEKALQQSHVVAHVEGTSKREPVYMVTGYIYVEGAKLSKERNKSLKVGGEVSASEPNSGVSAGVSSGYTKAGSSSTGFDGSTPFILGIRVRKIWWEKDGTNRTSDKVAGAVLDSDRLSKGSIFDDMMYQDDVSFEKNNTQCEVFEQKQQDLGLDSSIWVLPELEN